MDYWFSELASRLRMLPPTRRYLYDQIDWSSRCIGLLGARGVGKTTLMLQYLSSQFSGSAQALYISVDHPRFQFESLYEFGRRFSSHGGRVLFLDEVHKYEQWARHIKTLYDACPDLRLVFSGSSLLKLQVQGTDLSRRAVFYRLPGLSFREYLFFQLQLSFPRIACNDLLSGHVGYAQEVCRQVKPLEHFGNYLRFGYYPYFLEGREVYPLKVNEVIKQVLETDLPIAGHVDTRQIVKLKKLVNLIAINVPSQVNIHKLAATTAISRPKVYQYLDYLDKARLLNLIGGAQSGYKLLAKPDKIYLENPNLAYALADAPNIGTVRETFFAGQLVNVLSAHAALANLPISCATPGDFLINNHFTVEIGGRNKSRKQIKGIDHAFIVADDLEIGFGDKIPLWLFGFLY